MKIIASLFTLFFTLNLLAQTAQVKGTNTFTGSNIFTGPVFFQNARGTFTGTVPLATNASFAGTATNVAGGSVGGNGNTLTNFSPAAVAAALLTNTVAPIQSIFPDDVVGFGDSYNVWFITNNAGWGVVGGFGSLNGYTNTAAVNYGLLYPNLAFYQNGSTTFDATKTNTSWLMDLTNYISSNYGVSVGLDNSDCVSGGKIGNLIFNNYISAGAQSTYWPPAYQNYNQGIPPWVWIHDISPVNTGRRKILTGIGGGNDINSTGPTNVFMVYSNECVLGMQDGYIVVAMTYPFAPNGYSAGALTPGSTNVALFNQMIRNNPQIYNALFDLNVLETNYSNVATNFIDGTHPTDWTARLWASQFAKFITTNPLVWSTAPAKRTIGETFTGICCSTNGNMDSRSGLPFLMALIQDKPTNAWLSPLAKVSGLKAYSTYRVHSAWAISANASSGWDIDVQITAPFFANTWVSGPQQFSTIGNFQGADFSLYNLVLSQYPSIIGGHKTSLTGANWYTGYTSDVWVGQTNASIILYDGQNSGATVHTGGSTVIGQPYLFVERIK